MKIIAYPLKKGGSKWNDNELRLSLRSIEKHWRGEFDEVVVLGSDVPAWVNRHTVRVVDAPGYMDAWKEAMKIAGDDGTILWMNDDILFCQDTDWAELTSPQRRICANQVGRKAAQKWTTSPNGWRKKMGHVMIALQDAGLPSYNFASHTPYVFEVDKLKVIFDRFGKLGYKLSVECAYYNTFLEEIGGTNRKQDKFRCSTPKSVMGDMRQFRFINLCDGGLTPEMKGYVFGRFPYPCKYEVSPPALNPLREGSFRNFSDKDKNRPERVPVPAVVDVNVAGRPIEVTQEAPVDKRQARRARRMQKLAAMKAVAVVSTHKIVPGNPMAQPATAKASLLGVRERMREWRAKQTGEVAHPPIQVQVQEVTAEVEADSVEDFDS